MKGEFRDTVEKHLKLYADANPGCPSIVIDTRCRSCGAHYSLVALLPIDEKGLDILRVMFDTGVIERLKKDALEFRKEKRTCHGEPAPFYAFIFISYADLKSLDKDTGKETKREEVIVATASGARGERLVLMRKKDGTVEEVPSAVSRFFLPEEANYVY